MVCVVYCPNSIKCVLFQVAKSVSLRLHTELDVVHKKSLQLEWENEELREQVQNLEVANQVLQAEMNKSREVQKEIILSNYFFAWIDTMDFENIFYVVLI